MTETSGAARLLPLLFAACVTAAPHMPMVTRYPVATTRHTPGGVAVDDPRGEIDDSVVDKAFTAVETCLATKPRQLSYGDMSAAGGMNCSYDKVPAQLDRAALVVKVAPDWHVSPCTGQQLFPCQIDERGCDAKGLPSMPGCPCQCRHAVQESHGVYTLVVTPNALLLRAAIVEAATGCQDPWAGLLAECTR